MLVFSNYPKNHASKIYKSLVTRPPEDQPPCGSSPKRTAVYETNLWYRQVTWRCPILTTADRILKLILVSQASGNNLAKGMHYSFLNLKVFSFVLSPPHKASFSLDSRQISRFWWSEKLKYRKICVSKSIGPALWLEVNLPFLLFFTLYLRAIFQIQAPQGAYI